MTNPPRALSILVTALALTLISACSVGQDSSEAAGDDHDTPVTSVFSVNELIAQSPTGTAVLDLQLAEYGYRVEPGVNTSQVEVICPTGSVFNLESWLDDIGISADPAGDGLFMYSSGRRVDGEFVGKKVPECFDPCYLHQEPDRTWVCFCP